MDFAQGAVKSQLRQLIDAELEEILNSDKSEKIKQFVREELNRRKSFLQAIWRKFYINLCQN